MMYAAKSAEKIRNSNRCLLQDGNCRPRVIVFVLSNAHKKTTDALIHESMNGATLMYRKHDLVQRTSRHA